MNNCFQKLYNKDIIVYSIIVPVYNQENIIVEHIKSYIINTLDNFEIIIILDSCSDNTKDNLLDFISNFKNLNKNFIQIRIIETLEPLFETKCDNIGFKIAKGKFLLEIQADMKMTEKGYNIHLAKPFNLLNNVIAVSGRCAHNLYQEGGVGKLGKSIMTEISKLNVDKDTFYTYETCNRGPLLLDRKKVEDLGYLDEENYFLDNSDHDLMARAYIFKKYICGYVPIDFEADLKNGSTRKTKDERNIKKLNELNSKIDRGHINKYRETWKPLQPKQYDLTGREKIVFDFENENGFFCLFFFFIQTYIYCVKNNYNLYIKDTKWKYLQLDNYISLNKNILKYETLNSDCNAKFFTHMKTPDVNYTLNEYKKYSKDVYKIKENILVKYNLPENYNSIYIRGGDKLLYEAKQIPISHYVNKLLDVDNETNNLFVHSDDNLIVEKVINYVKDNNIDLKIFKITDETNNGGAVIMKRLKYGTCRNVKSVDEMSSEEVKNYNNQFLNSVEIMRNSKNIVCSFDSNVSRFMKINFDCNVYTVNGTNDIEFQKIVKNPAFGFN